MKRGQVWVETVIYTLVGLSLIGLVLAFVTPRINEYRDKAVIEQTIESLNDMDAKVQEVIQTGPGNVRRVDFQLKRGTLFVNASNDSITYSLEDSALVYSEPGVPTALGRISVLTTVGANTNTVTLSINYPANLVLANGEAGQTFSYAATPYQFSFLFNNTESARPVIIVREL